MNTPENLLQADDVLAEAARPAGSSSAAPAGVKIVVNGRTVVHRHFLQEAMDAMVRRALVEEPLAGAAERA